MPLARPAPVPYGGAQPYAARRAYLAQVAARRAKLAQGRTFSLDLARVLHGVFSVNVGFPLSSQLEAGPVLAAGSPERARFDRYNTFEAGGYVSWFGLGDRARGVGFTGRARYLYGAGEGTSESGDDIEASAHALALSGLVAARYTALSGLRLELQGGVMWIHSRATARQGDAEQRSTLTTPTSTVSLLLGWTF